MADKRRVIDVVDSETGQVLLSKEIGAYMAARAETTVSPNRRVVTICNMDKQGMPTKDVATLVGRMEDAEGFIEHAYKVQGGSPLEADGVYIRKSDGVIRNAKVRVRIGAVAKIAPR